MEPWGIEPQPPGWKSGMLTTIQWRLRYPEGRKSLYMNKICQMYFVKMKLDTFLSKREKNESLIHKKNIKARDNKNKL